MDFNFKKKYGQNFLKDKRIIDSIVLKSGADKDTLVLEIGPGAGALTSELVKKAGHVIAFEIDESLKDILDSKLNEYNNVEVLYGDFLETNVNEIIEKYDYSKKIMVSNLPYYITTPIIMKLIENNLDIKSITVMIQKEVAERLIAIPGTKNAGAITYTVYYYCESKKIREVENTCFIPAPEVTSEVINLKLRDKAIVDVENKKIFFNIIKSAYMQRRKTVVNSLANVGVFQNKEQGIEYMKKLGLKEDVRAENLTIEDFAKLTNLYIKNLLNK